MVRNIGSFVYFCTHTRPIIGIEEMVNSDPKEGLVVGYSYTVAAMSEGTLQVSIDLLIGVGYGGVVEVSTQDYALPLELAEVLGENIDLRTTTPCAHGKF